MGTIILVAFTIFSAVVFYILDSFHHRKLYVSSVIDMHWNDRVLIEERNKGIKDKYPVLYEVVRSLSNSDIKFTSKKITNNIKQVKGNKNKELRKEIQTILDSEDEEAIKVVMWYYMACSLITYTQSSKVESINEINDETKKIQNKDFDDLDNKNLLCFS